MLLGPSLKLGTPWLEDARATDAFNLGFLAAYRVMKSRCMVHSPKRATLFYVPLLRRGKSSQAACANERDHLERMRALFKTSDGVAYMDRNAGADHVTVSSRTGWSFDACEATFNSTSRLGRATRIVVDGGPRIAWPGAVKPLLDPRTGLMWPPRRTLNYSAGLYLTVPSAGAISSLKHVPLSGIMRPHYAVLFAAASGHSNRLSARKLREQLRLQCRRVASGCLDGARMFGSLTRNVVSTSMPMRRHALKLYANATFCLQPAGDWPSRVPAMTDSLAAGCIPVFFHDVQLHIWPVHWGDWIADASVMLPFQPIVDGTLDVMERLFAIPADAIERMQRTIRANYGRLVYTLDNNRKGAPDALDAALAVAAEYARASVADAPHRMGDDGVVGGSSSSPAASFVGSKIAPPRRLSAQLTQCCWWGGGTPRPVATTSRVKSEKSSTVEKHFLSRLLGSLKRLKLEAAGHF